MIENRSIKGGLMKILLKQIKTTMVVVWRGRFVSLSLMVLLCNSKLLSAGDTPLATAAIVKMGDGTVSGARLTPYDNAWLVTQTFADGRINEPGIWTDQLRLREVSGRKVFVRTQGMAYYNGKFISSVNVFDPTTMAPISDQQHVADGSTEKWTLNGSHAEGHLVAATPEAKEQIQQFDSHTPGYDFNCCMRSLMAATLPLRMGYSVTLPNEIMSKDDDQGVTYKVVGREQARAGERGMVDTWVVQIDPSPGGCDCVIRFWVNDKSPFIIRMTLSAGKGHEYDQSFDMIK
jgi:hypothetical protein